ncbi:hypothetical protein GGF50DRAFT_113906 [Schizophyllum commune]
MSIMLAVGLPALAGYSLVFTISPKCEAERLEKAVHDANWKAHHFATPESIIRSDARYCHRRALTLLERYWGLLYVDQQCSCANPNYFSEAQAVETIS